jgi:hypothetical protein
MMIGAATAAEYVDVAKAAAQRAILLAKLGWIAVVEILGFVEFCVTAL